VHATVPLTQEATVRYTLDPAKSNFVVQAFSTGLLSAFAHDPKIAVRDFAGEAEFVPAEVNLQGARMRIRVVSDSLQPIDDISDADKQEIHRRMGAEVLHSDRFPEIVYECSRITGSASGDRYWAALNGQLTLCGVTRPLLISARVVVNGSSLRASGEFSLRQSEFGIAPVAAAAGTIRVKDEVKCTFDILAHKQE
jgi:polyisoprenoid-binding protein YceI